MSQILTAQRIAQSVRSVGLIEHADIDHCLAPASYELRVGSYLDWRSRRSVELTDGETIAIAPHGFVLVGTVEKVNLPLDMLGMMYLRSTYARLGFVSWFQGIVDPGYTGTLTVALHNLTAALLPVRGLDRICHLVFHHLAEAADKGYEGQYQGSSGATSSPSEPALKVVGTLVESPFGTFGVTDVGSRDVMVELARDPGGRPKHEAEQ